MDDKDNKKSSDILVDVQQLLNETAPSIYQGKTPAWRKYFQSWARNTLNQDYFKTLVNHRLSIVAFGIIKQAPLRRGQDADLDIFLKGVAYGVEMLYGDIKQASAKQEENKKEK